MPKLFSLLCSCLAFAPMIAAESPSSTTVHIVHNVHNMAWSQTEIPGISANAIVPFRLQRGHLIVAKCSVGGLDDLTAIIDTGASETVLDIALAKKLRLALEPDSATFISHQGKVWAVTIPELELGPLRADHLQGIATDLSSLTAELGIRPQVVIGMDVLHRASFLIDYQSHQLVFFQVAQFQAPQGPMPRLTHRAALISGESVRFPVIEASIAGKTVRLQVDSGFDGLLVYGNHMQSGAITTSESQIANLGQTLLSHTSTPPDLEIGDWRRPHPHLTVVDGPPPESAGFDGLIGTAFLSQKKVAFDFQKGMIYWE